MTKDKDSESADSLAKAREIGQRTLQEDHRALERSKAVSDTPRDKEGRG